ncbi:STAS domain-containing protein [Patescibacteria group bacterium]|nr:STAS domain-containing protein [Patescibacteria group bacterium]
MAQVQITFQDVNVGGKAIKLIAFAGQLDETNVDNEAQKIYQVIEEMAEPNLILDFLDLEYMNSKSIGYVTDWYSKVMSKNGKIVITRPRVNILDILKVVGITQIVTVYENLEEAKASFGAAVAPAPEVAAVGATPNQTETPQA